MSWQCDFLSETYQFIFIITNLNANQPVGGELKVNQEVKVECRAEGDAHQTGMCTMLVVVTVNNAPWGSASNMYKGGNMQFSGHLVHVRDHVFYFSWLLKTG